MSAATRAARAAAAVAVLGSLPYWLPPAVVRLRVRIFARVNGEEGVPVPGPEVGTAAFERLYAHPAANGRSRGAALSDLFWYWLAPGPEVHQEHLEPGPRYEAVARTTRRALTAVRRQEWDRIVRRRAYDVLEPLTGGGTRVVRLRDLAMPLWAAAYHEVVFREPCPDEVRDLIVGNADDVVSALKCTGVRHMDRRDRLTRYLLGRIRAGDVPFELPEGLSDHERACYLQGTFFNTAVVQMSEATAHVLLAIATRPEVRERLRREPADSAYLDHVIEETLRYYPLFGVAHRITTDAITIDSGDPHATTPVTKLPAGSVLLFDYARYHRTGVPDADRFDPDRWARPRQPDLHHVPFGVAANRPCPARGIAPMTLRTAVEEVLKRFEPVSSARHDRSMPNRGPCLLVPRENSTRLQGTAVRLVAMRVRDRWEDVTRSLAQLAYGSWMVADARGQRLCGTYFDAVASGVTTPGPATAGHDAAARCPVTGEGGR
ncbi:cytochrome P450 [Streptomyces sp. PTM05]|uniref:Cytochrome P450 n=1 Tax=Streptantibioticus parmotrematis TaxID=2873249 RepID=A0ABS7QQI8_9ACTN|nr:cytochrome P450 [Streptantibioticus parmotrematis]MBY8885455.1 cytochrome P450 [Streptantibioticus parmotrematis]